MKKIGLLVLLGILLHFSAGAQYYTYQLFGVKEGLPGSRIYSICQDTNGLIWLGTDVGLCSFNGYNFEHFPEVGGKNIGPVNAVVCTPQGEIWFGGTGGLFRYSHGEFSRQTSLTQIISLEPFGDAQLAIGSMKNLQLLDFATGKLSTMGNWESLQVKKGVSDITRTENYTWVSTSTCVYRMKDKTWEKIWGDESRSEKINSLLAFTDDSVYWGCEESSFYVYHNGKVEMPHPEMYFCKGLAPGANQDMAVLLQETLYFYKNGKIFPALYSNEMTSRSFTCIFKDRENNFWAGSIEGLYFFKPNLFQPMYSDASITLKEIYSVTHINDSLSYWGGNHGMVYKINDRTGEIISSQHIFPNAEVNDILVTPEGTWFASQYEGFAFLDNSGKITSFGLADGIFDTEYKFIIPWHNNAFLAGGFGGFVTIGTGEKKYSIKRYNLPNNTIAFTGVLMDREQVLLGTNTGLVLYDIINQQKAELPAEWKALDNIRITKILKTGNRIIISTLGKGIYIYRQTAENTWETEHTSTGFPKDIFSPNILSFTFYEDKIIYLDYGGVGVWSPGKAYPAYFSSDEGFLPQNFYTGGFTISGNDIYIFTANGSVKFSSKLLQHYPPGIFLKSAELNGNIIPTGKMAEVFPYWQNDLSMDLKLVHYFQSMRNRLFVRINGWDSSWYEFSGKENIVFNNLPPGDYSVDIKGVNAWGEEIYQPAKIRFIIRPAYWTTWWFYALISLFILCITLVLLYFRWKRIKRINREKLHINTLIANLEAKALRAQMNPHFIFNSLNSIQALIVTQNVKNAYKYLNKFSRLLRQVLEASMNQNIRLDKEIDLLNLYIELESLRFDDSFHHTIEHDPDLDPELVMIPGLMIQPFVENAIWHGLLAKDGEKNLSVYFEEEGDLVKCTIRDNGVGREAAKQGQAGQVFQKAHSGKGMKIIHDQIEILHKQGVAGARIEISDMKDEKGDAVGTTVNIWLPNLYGLGTQMTQI